MRRVSLREFNRNWGTIIGAVEDGETVELTRRGEAIATIVPARARKGSATHRRAVKRLMEHLRTVSGTLEGPPYQWNRDEIYEERLSKMR